MPKVLCGRQRYCDGGPGALAADVQLAAVGLGNRAAKRQTDAEAIGLGGRKWRQLVHCHRRRKAWPRIADAELDETRSVSRGPNRNLAAAVLGRRDRFGG